MEIICSIIFKKMRTNHFFLTFLLTIMSLSHSAIIITSSLPHLYQLNSKQTLIVFDEPSTHTFNPSQDYQGINHQNETHVASQNNNQDQSLTHSEYNNLQNADSESIEHLFPKIPNFSNPAAKSNALQSPQKTVISSEPTVPLSLQNPFITSAQPQSQPFITSSSQPFITSSQQRQKVPSNGQSSVKQSTFISSSKSTITMTSTSTTIVTNYGQISTQSPIHHIRLFSSFGTIANRPDQQRYRSLIQQRNRDWIRSQKNLSFKLAQNHFSHLTLDEFKQLYLNLQVPKVVNVVQLDFKSILKRFFQINDQTFNSWFGNHFNRLPINPFRPVSPSNNNNSASNSTSNSTSNNSTSNSTANNSTTNNSTTNNSTANNSTANNSTSNNSTSNNSTKDSTSNSTSNNSTSNSSSTNNSTSNTTSNSTTDSKNTSPIINIDWTVSGVVSPVKDQGSCGGCYAFAANGAMQSAYLMKNKLQYSQIDLSEQQILDCSSNHGNKGCNGGWLSHVFDYVKIGGLTTQSAYPYTQTSGPCKIAGGSFKISSYTGGKLADCNALVAMVTGRPTSIAVAAGSGYWMNYAGGILNQCGTGIDHGVLLVGVFQNSTANYWKIKNSWGPSWGQKGYIRVNRNVSRGNLCDLCGYGYYPTV